MANTSTVVDKLSLKLHFKPIKSYTVVKTEVIKKKISYWWREGRKGGTLAKSKR